MNLLQSLRIQAHANRLANRRLHSALAELTHADFCATRTGFFPSFAATLNHILAIDLYCVRALHGNANLTARNDTFVAAEDITALAERQRICDERLIEFCNRLDEAGCSADVAMERGNGRVQCDLAGHVLAHLFMHQTHHRGQAHASGNAAAPPQLDEFTMPSEAHLRSADMAALGWDEATVYGTGAR